MDSYSLLLERIRAPQPSIQRFAVISVFEKLRSDGPDSDAARTALSHCLRSKAAPVVDQTVREVCRIVKGGKMRVSQGLLELQAALEGCDDPRFVDVFVKGIGFLCRFGFRNDLSWRFESVEGHPFVKVTLLQLVFGGGKSQVTFSQLVTFFRREAKMTRALESFFKLPVSLIQVPADAGPSMVFTSMLASEIHKLLMEWIFVVLSSQAEAQAELVQQVLLFISQNMSMGFARISEFLRPFLMFSVLRIPFSVSSSSFVKQLISSMASVSCSFPLEGMLIIKLLAGCLKYFPRNNPEELKYLICSTEYLVDASMVILKQAVATKMPTDELQVCGVELLETLLSFCTELHKPCGGIEPVTELSRRLLLVQKELGLQYLPAFVSVVTSLSLILTQAEFEHEQLSVLKLSIFLLKWKSDNEHIMGRATCCLNEELLFIFPVINLLSSPSKSVKAAAIDLLSDLERLLADFAIAPKKVPVTPVGLPTVSKPESITCRLLHHLWSKDQSSLSNSYFLKLVCNGMSESECKRRHGEQNSWVSQLREYSLMIAGRQKSALISQCQENLLTGMPLLLCGIISVLVVHPTLANSAVDSLAAIGIMDPKMGVPLLLSVLFYNKIFCHSGSKSHAILLKLLGMLPSLASHSVMVPLIVQTILPMLHKDARQVLYATAVRLLSKTWEVTDRVFGSLQGILQPLAFSEFVSERNICMSMAASVRDVCKQNPDRGVDLILTVSACIESQDPTIKAFGFESIGHLCEADVVDFYTAWDVIAKHAVDYSVHPNIAYGLCNLLRWGAMDAKAYSEASKSVMQILWEIGTSRYTGSGTTWIKARTSAFESLTHYEVEHIRKGISDFNRRSIESLISEDNLEVLRAMESLEVKIITFEHITRRRLVKEKRVMVNKVEKLLDVFPQVMFSSGKSRDARELPGAALLSIAFNPKDMRGQGTSKEFLKLHVSYENALMEMAESLQLSRNILLALLSLQSWKPFMHRWMRSVITFPDAKVLPNVSNKGSKAADDILKSMCRIAEESIPRSAENIALAIGALCMVSSDTEFKPAITFSGTYIFNGGKQSLNLHHLILPPSAHAVTSTASKFLLKWLFQYEHEHRQWSAAISLGLISSCLHATDSRHKFLIITGLLEVASNSKSILVKGACGVGLGFTCQDLLTRVEAGDVSNLEEEDGEITEATLLGNIVQLLCSMICQLCPSSFDSLQSLCKSFPLGTDDICTEEPVDLYSNNDNNMEEDIWGVAALVLGLANSIVAMYRVGAHDAVLKIKDMLISWIPYVNSSYQDTSIHYKKPEIPLSVGSCLALPTVVAFCHRTELMDDDELDPLVDGYRALISELLTVKKSGTYHQSLLMASCIGAGNLLSCILNEGVHSMKADDVKSLLELIRNTYTKPYPPAVHLGGMLGVVNALGAGAGTLTHTYPQRSSLQTDHEAKDSSYVRGPVLSSLVCEPLCTSLMQEMFLVAQDSKDRQIQRYAAWALSFLRHRWWSKESHTVNASRNNPIESKPISHSFAEDSTVWQLCLWLMDLNASEMGTITHVNTVATILRCLSQAPRLPSLDWGAIVRRCMKYEDQVSSVLNPNIVLKKGALREECIRFSLAHANQVSPLLFFVDELSDISRFRTLELNLQSFLLRHLADAIKIFSGSRLEKLFDDIVDYFSSSTSYQSYNPDQKSLLRTSFWSGLYYSLGESSTEVPEHISNMEKCMELLFCLLPASPCEDGLVEKQASSENEWSEAVRCLGKAPKDWLMDILQVPEMNLVRGSHFAKGVKKIFAKAKLVLTGSIPVTELRKLKPHMLNTESDGIWCALVEVVAALQCAEGSIKRQWLLDAVEISCITKYPSTALQFLGLLSSSCCKYMPLLILDHVAVLSDLPVTLPSLLSDSNWLVIAEPVVLNLWASTERIYAWAMQVASGNDFSGSAPIDRSESSMSVSLAQVMHSTCVSLKDYLPFEKQLRLANMVLP